MSLADRLTAAWYQGHPALVLLRPLEWLYRRVVLSKRRAFLAGQGDIYRAAVPVVVVGNVTVGGTGKTPMILWLIEHCRARGLRVGVVSRGYGATPPQLPTVVSAAEYRQGVADGLWHVVTLGIAPDDAQALAQPPVLALPTADAAGLRVLRQALDGSGDGGAPTSIPSFWLAVAADAADQARLQALWDLQQAAQPLLWLHEGLDGYRRYLVQQHQLAAHAGRALPRLCGL